MKVEECTLCPLHQELPNGCTPIPGIGDEKADIMFVNDFPSKNDIVQQEQIGGRVGKYFHNLLEKADISREKTYTSSALHCWPSNKNKDRQPKKDELAACKLWLWADIKRVQPAAIVGFGATVVNLLGGPIFNKKVKLKDVVGQSFELPYTQTPTMFFPCYHPKFTITRSKTLDNEVIDVLTKVNTYLNEKGLPK